MNTAIKELLTETTYFAIKELGPCTKKDIKSKVLDIAEKNNYLTKDFVLAYEDIGWVLLQLRNYKNMKPAVVCYKNGDEYLWVALDKLGAAVWPAAELEHKIIEKSS